MVMMKSELFRKTDFNMRPLEQNYTYEYTIGTQL